MQNPPPAASFGTIILTSNYSKEEENPAIDPAAKRILASKKLTREFLQKLGFNVGRPTPRAKSASRSTRTPLAGKAKAPPALRVAPSGLIIGHHGCEAALVQEVVNGRKKLIRSRSGFDWLCEGIYFWAHDPQRALEGAADSRLRRIAATAVLSAVIDPGN